MSDNKLEKIIKKLETLEARISQLEQGRKNNTPDNQSDSQKKLSLREFLLSKKPTDDVKKTLAIGYYLEKYEGLNSFNINDLEVAFERAKEKKPTNMNDKVNMNIRNAHLEETSEKKDSRKSWYLTNSGEQYVENGFKTQK